MFDAKESHSTRPYLIRGLYEWCTDNGFTPFIAVLVDDSVRVPNEFVKDGEIVLNISFDATSSLKLGNEFIEFKARFAGKAREIMVPIRCVIAIYARENGQGMAFPTPAPGATALPEEMTDEAVVVKGEPPAVEPGKVISLQSVQKSDAEGPELPKPPSGPRPALKRVK